jgi:hypothetical protein
MSFLIIVQAITFTAFSHSTTGNNKIFETEELGRTDDISIEKIETLRILIFPQDLRRRLGEI